MLSDARDSSSSDVLACLTHVMHIRRSGSEKYPAALATSGDPVMANSQILHQTKTLMMLAGLMVNTLAASVVVKLKWLSTYLL